MAAVAREPGAAVVPTVSPPEPRPPDLVQTLPDLPPGLSEPSLVSHKEEERCRVPEKAITTEANAELMLQSQDCTEANGNAERMLQSQDCMEAGSHANTELMDLLPELPVELRPLKPLSDPGTEQDPVQSAVSPLSLPAAPQASEAGLSLGQPNGPDRACTDRTRSPERSECFTALWEQPARGPMAPPLEPREEDLMEDAPETESSSELRPGTHVRVSLDHVIDDALVVSFCVGHKVFSGVLMDLSRRFGPYGIPITVFPPRRESSRRHVQAPPPAEAPPPPAEVAPPPNTTPLFHQGAPYPPPLFLRDSYHTNLPQPLPRRIKRSRRRYGNSEEPTCMLVRLRPRQVLCDRCKGAAGPKPAPVSTRRRHNPDPPEENLSAEVKRLRGDEPRPPRPRREGPRVAASGATGGGNTAPPPRRHATATGDANRDQRNHREPTARSSQRSAPGTVHRVLTRRISALTPPLTPPRVRLKPHRYRTDTEPPNQTRPGPQRNKTRTKPPPPPQPSQPSRRHGPKPGTKPGTKPGPKPEPKPIYKPEPKTHRKDPLPRAAPGTKQETEIHLKPETEIRTKTRSDPKPDPDPEPRPQHRPSPDPVPVSRSRRKQVFPRPTRDFDLDFMGWSGPDSDLDRTEPDVKSEQLSPDRDLDLLVCKESPKMEPETGSEINPEPDLGLDCDLVQASEPESDLVFECSPTAVDNDTKVQYIKPDPDPQNISAPEPESSDSDRSLDIVLSETGPRHSPEPVVHSDPSSPTLSESSTRSQSAPELTPEVDPTTDIGPAPEPGPAPETGPAAEVLSNNGITLEQRLAETSDPRSDLDLNPDSGLPSDPAPLSGRMDPGVSPGPGAGLGRRSLQKCVGADGRLVSVGDIVWAKIAGFPWWPARVLSLTVRRRGDGGVAARQEVRVAWFGSRTTSLLPLSHTSPFLETFQTRFDRKRKGPYRRAVAEAASAAKQLTPENHAPTAL